MVASNEASKYRRGQKVVLCSTHFNPEDFKRDLKVSET